MIILGNYGQRGVSVDVFRINHDIVVFPIHTISNYVTADKFNQSELRQYMTYFKGQIIQGHKCSPGIRPRLFQLGKALIEEYGPHNRYFTDDRAFGMSRSYFSWSPAVILLFQI